MKKPYNAERAGFKIETNSINLLLIVFFLTGEIFSQEIQSSIQTPINGFCQFNSFNIEKNFNSLFSLNYNNDSYTDLVLYSKDQKKIVSLTGKPNGKFSRPIVHSIPYQITDIQHMIERNALVKRYAFISRQNRRAGIYSFTSSGSAYLSGSIRFNSFPGDISTADINKNGKDELLISGSSFNGLSIVYLAGSGLKQKKIVDNINFSDAVFADLSNDGYPDIAAFNIFKNSLEFYFNNSRGDFQKVRSIKMDEPIYQLHSVDMNLDNYTDLIFAKGKSINIIYGDFASAYDRSLSIKTKFYPDQIITGDFNRDGKIDIAYINKKNGIFSVFFAKSDSGFYPEVLYFKKDGTNKVIPFYSKFINGIAAASDSGYVYTVTNLLSFSSEVNLSLGAAPTAISTFDLENNGISDICFIDSYNSMFNIVERNISGIPSGLYSCQLFTDHSKIIVDNQDPRIKTFFCYSQGKRLIEILKTDFIKNTIDKISVYSPGEIADLRIKKNENSFDNIYIAYKNKNQLGFCIMEYRDYRYVSTNYPNIASNFYSANITLNNNAGIIDWEKANFGASLNFISFSGGSINKRILYQYNSSEINSISSFTGDLLNADKDITLTFIHEKDKTTAIATDYSTAVKLKNTNLPLALDLNSTSNLYFGSPRPAGLKKLYFYSEEENKIYRVDFILRGRDIAVSKLIEARNVGSFFVGRMSPRRTHLIFTDTISGCIAVEQL